MKSFKHYFIRNCILYSFCAIVSIVVTAIMGGLTLNAGLVLGILLSEVVVVPVGAAFVALIEKKYDQNR